MVFSLMGFGSMLCIKQYRGDDDYYASLFDKTNTRFEYTKTYIKLAGRTDKLIAIIVLAVGIYNRLRNQSAERSPSACYAYITAGAGYILFSPPIKMLIIRSLLGKTHDMRKIPCLDLIKQSYLAYGRAIQHIELKPL